MVEIVADNISILGECPVWNTVDNRLYWTDILEGKIYCYDPYLRQYWLFWQGSQKVGGFAFTHRDDMVMCTDKGVYIRKKDTGQMDLIFDIIFDPDERFNDITTDPAGRIFAGSVKSSFKDGKLYRLEKNKAPEVVKTGIGCSNGMAFSIDQKYFFHTDSISREIMVYDYDISTGNIENPKLFFKAKETDGLPDGITIDVNDNIWVAFWGGSCIRKIGKTGLIEETISVPAIQPSSVMFGGKNLNEIYITSACVEGVKYNKESEGESYFIGGYLYKYFTKTMGRKEFTADF